MAPITSLPNVSLGNAASDIGSAANSFVKGLLAQRQVQTADALKAALTQAQLLGASAEMERALHPDPFNVTSVDDSGHLVHALMDKRSGETSLSTGPGTRAPESTMLIPTVTNGTPSVAQKSRYNPDAPATPVELPPGSIARPAPDQAMPVETVNGPQIVKVPATYGGGRPTGPGGSPLMPRASEADERRAKDAFEMIQGQNEIANVATKHPEAYNEAASYMATRNFLNEIPIIGGPLDQVLAGSQAALSPAAQAYVRAFTQLASARAFSRGGATLTANEIKWAMDAIAPRAWADPATRMATQRMIRTIIAGNVIGNPAWQRYKALATQLGFGDPNDASQIVAPQSTGRVNPYTGVSK